MCNIIMYASGLKLDKVDEKEGKNEDGGRRGVKRGKFKVSLKESGQENEKEKDMRRCRWFASSYIHYL